MKKLSLIIPCFNESKNLPTLLSKCKEIFALEKNIEIILVDNGSTDDTSEVLDRISADMSFIRRVKVDINYGYGYGILAGLSKANGEIIGWTHADLQTEPSDVLIGFDFFQKSSSPELLFIKGKRHNRPILDTFFTIGMALFETILLRRVMWDINAQPTLFHKSFFLNWSSPPNDFALDLYAYYFAIKSGLKIKRFPVHFKKRLHGESNWNFSFSAKYRFIKRTLFYSFKLRRKMN